MNKRLFLLLVFVAAFATALAKPQTKVQTAASPDGRLQLTVQTSPTLVWALRYDQRVIMNNSNISMTLSNGTVWGAESVVKGVERAKVEQIILSPVYKKNEVEDNYNLLTIKYKNGCQIEFRLYNEGMAYRFVSLVGGRYNVVSEQAEFNFCDNHTAYCPYANVKKADNYSLENQYFTSFENTYSVVPLQSIDSHRLMFAPVLVDVGEGVKVLITEADLRSYPGMFLTNAEGRNRLAGHFAPLPVEWHQGGHNMLQNVVERRADYLAAVEGERSFPWRVVVVTDEDRKLVDNDMVYRLAEPNRVGDVDWVRAGKVAWDWWNCWGIYGVDFEAGVNTATYKHYIDYAAQTGVEYVILDEGWSVNKAADLMQVVPEIDLPAIVDYAAQRGVGIILWAGYLAFDRDMERVCQHYSDMGVKGFKIDFMDRDDQLIVDFYERAAATCAKHKLLCDFHGAYKPTGLSRTYPNVVNYEGVHGLEQMKWASKDVDQVTYDVTIPFIRMVAGPMDYTQGAMRNSAMRGYAPNYCEPMSQGTRCHQLGMYVVYESPLNMMCDSPDNYRREKECAEFIASVPTVWDETKALQGSVGEYVVVARRSGSEWFVGGLNDWNERETTFDLTFLPRGDYNVTIFKDGANANRTACDYKTERFRIGSNGKITVKMAQGGGFAAHIAPVEE